MLSPIENYSCHKLLKNFNLRRKDVLMHATKILCLLGKLHLLASCWGEPALPCAHCVPWKGWNKSTTLPRKKIKEKLWEVWTRLILCSKWGKMPRELLLKILLRNIQPPKFTAIIWVQNSVLLFVRHILSKWHGVKFKNSALSVFHYGFILH